MNWIEQRKRNGNRNRKKSHAKQGRSPYNSTARNKIAGLVYNLLVYAFLAAMALLILLPVLWMLLSAFRPPNRITIYPPQFFPREWTLFNFSEVFRLIPISRYIINTVVYAVVVTAVSLLFNSMAGYAFARMRFKGKNFLFTAMMASIMIPFQVIMIPLFMEIYYMGLFDTYAGLFIPRFAVIIGIFFMRAFFTTLPKQLEEAGRIDGLSEFGIFFRIMLPLCKTALMTQAVLSLTGCWNDLLWPLLMTNTPQRRMLANGIIYFTGQNITAYGPSFASGVISVLPLFIVFVIGQKYFVNSIVSTGLKDA